MKVCWLFWLLLCTGLAAWAKEPAVTYFSDCGTTEEIPGDVRTRAPWTAAIYIRPLDSENPRFFTTGTIIGPTTVLTMARGAFGSSLRGSSPNLPPPGSFFVVVGISVTGFGDRDRYLQKSEVIFLEPDLSSDENQGNDYHFMIFHLRTILNFESPYVKALCLLPLHWDQHSELNPFGLMLNSSGFAVTTSTEARTAVLATDQVLTLSKEECNSTFSFYYKRELNEQYTYCGVKSGAYEADTFKNIRVVQPRWDATNFRFGETKDLLGGIEEEEESCFLHGAVNTVLIDSKMYLAGMIALIPGKRQGICNDGNLYYYARPNKYLAWLHQSVHCSPNKFSCGGVANTCLPLSKVCNRQSDCPGNGRDEHPILCELSNHCLGNSTSPDKMSCGLNGDCLSKSQVCDGTLDCLDGNDEDPEQCKRLLAAALGNGTLEKNCARFKIPTVGVVVSCRNKFAGRVEDCGLGMEPGTNLQISCAPFHTSNYGYSTFSVTCDGASGEWLGRRPFSCIPDCGTLQTQPNEDNPAEPQNLPWNLIIGEHGFLENEALNCSGVLIDESFILTAASCVPDLAVKPFAILEPTSRKQGLFTLLDEGNAQIVRVRKIWYPKWITGESVDLALAKVDRVGTNEKGQGTFVCYLNSAKIYKKLSRTNTTGQVIHIGDKLDSNGESKEEVLTSNYLLSGRSDCIQSFGLLNVPPFMFCGTTLGGSLLPSDIGAGLYISEKNPLTGSMQMHLKGIVVTPKTKLHNNTAEWGQLFINTDYFLNWATEVMSKNYLLD